MTKRHAIETERVERATDEVEPMSSPKKGDQYRCEVCGMELEITQDCTCNDHDAVRFQCCGQELLRL